MRKPRVVVTGLGVVAPNGIGKDAFWQALQSGRSGIVRITRFDASEFPCQIAGEVNNFDPTIYMTLREARRLPRVAQFGIAAAKMAVEDARLQVTPEQADKFGVCFGTSIGKPEIFEADHTLYLQRGFRGIHPLTVAEFSTHSTSSYVAIALGARGVCGTLSTGCTVSLDVVQWGYQQICLGRASMMVVGGTEALLEPFIFASTCAIGVLSRCNEEPHKASRPFDLYRDGMVLSEGAGAIILEAWEHAQERGAVPYAEVLGAASMREGTDLVRCDTSGTGMAQVMEIALAQSGLMKSCIDYVSAHGSALRDYDEAETNALKIVFGDYVYNIPVSSIKSMIGQPFAAAGAMQIIASCLTLQDGIVPPTINYSTPDPRCDLDYVPNRYRRVRMRNILVHAHGMSGTDSALVLQKMGS